jgi:hypothetical protein
VVRGSCQVQARSGDSNQAIDPAQRLRSTFSRSSPTLAPVEEGEPRQSPHPHKPHKWTARPPPSCVSAAADVLLRLAFGNAEASRSSFQDRLIARWPVQPPQPGDEEAGAVSPVRRLGPPVRVVSPGIGTSPLAPYTIVEKVVPRPKDQPYYHVR